MLQGYIQPPGYAGCISKGLGISHTTIYDHRLKLDISAAMKCIPEDIGQGGAVPSSVQLDHDPPGAGEEAGMAQILPGLALYILLKVLPAEIHS